MASRWCKITRSSAPGRADKEDQDMSFSVKGDYFETCTCDGVQIPWSDSQAALGITPLA